MTAPIRLRRPSASRSALRRASLRRAGLRRLAGGALALLLAACTNDPSQNIASGVGAAVEAQFPGVFGGAAEPPPEITRAALDEIRFATILIGRPGTEARGALFAGAVNDGYVTYVNAQRQSVTLRGGQVTATHGLFGDLAGYRSDPEVDPVVSPRPPEAWPDEVVRVYRDRDDLGNVFSRALICRPTVVGPERIEIVERVYDLVRIDEPCAGPSRRIENRYWVDPATGFVWRSRQWAGRS
ncbi:MAG: YjbF family lipoprotein, partial [Pseudomonadota bacterium]